MNLPACLTGKGLLMAFAGEDRQGFQLKFLFYGHPVLMAIVFLGIVTLGVKGWSAASEMRRKIKGDLGSTPNESDVDSIATWMKVDEVEHTKHPGQEWAPESDPDDGSRGL